MVSLSSTLVLACVPEAEPMLAAVGEACEQASDCASEICQHLVCEADQDGPTLSMVFPADLWAFDAGLPSVNLFFSIDSDDAAGDRVRVTIDPGTADEASAVFDAFVNGYVAGVTEVVVPGGLSDGPHRVLAQIIDADGEPYPNPSATDQRVIFVRDAVLPDTPQLAVHWPPPGHEYRADQPADLEIAVLPGSFAFSSLAGDCHPLDDCTPAFAPECGASCGSVSRSGSVIVYVEDGFPACLADEPISCEGQFIGLLEPGSDDAELLDGHLIRGPLFLLPGEYTLTAVLRYSSDYTIYPSEAEVIYDQISISVR
jgi:hypothetical protein